MISGNVLLFNDIKISLGILITARKMNALFRENRHLAVSTMQIIELESLLSNPNFQANLSS